MSSSAVSIVLVGVGGYGNAYVNALLDAPDTAAFSIAGVVDPFPEGCRRLPELRALGNPFYADLASFYREHTADLAVVSSPIAWHCEHTCLALDHGTHVLCEKPLCATTGQAATMREARDRAGRFVAVGYQWSFNEATQRLKRDILAGRLGRPRRLRTLVLWPRDAGYYARNDWAGALRDSQGRWVLDSPVNNATAHYLHNMFYAIGPAPDRSAVPVRVQAELYRANPITNYDTGACRVVTDTEVELLFYSSHAVDVQRGPEYVFEFEKAVVTYSPKDAAIMARFADGSVRQYGDPNRDGMKKLRDCLAAARGEGTIACGIEAASSQTLCMNGMQLSGGPVSEFPPGMVCARGRGGARVTYGSGLADVLSTCWERGCLPSELGVAWAKAGREVHVAGPEFRFPPDGS
ncbi:MAG: Gfo/Idh/MocA family oxidoreductase [Kiritimatiellaeota bacterium]|nr:Gfo/Idh/MocA family oxidoreductase [Kiritimatiellota bacterium]